MNFYRKHRSDWEKSNTVLYAENPEKYKSRYPDHSWSADYEWVDADKFTMDLMDQQKVPKGQLEIDRNMNQFPSFQKLTETPIHKPILRKLTISLIHSLLKLEEGKKLLKEELLTYQRLIYDLQHYHDHLSYLGFHSKEEVYQFIHSDQYTPKQKIHYLVNALSFIKEVIPGVLFNPDIFLAAFIQTGAFGVEDLESTLQDHLKTERSEESEKEELQNKKLKTESF
jgi:hypothetical protein